MKTRNVLIILLSSVFFIQGAFAGDETSVDVKTVETSDDNSSEDKDKEAKKSTSKKSTAKTNTMPTQLYIPNTEDDDEKPKKPRKKRVKRSSSKVITSVSDDKMPLAKPNAICPIGLEGVDARDIFRGFSYEGFQKAASDGESNLNHGFLPKPWGFYKGKDGVNYAVYAFKPDEKNIDMFLTESVSPLKLTRLKIKEYCALYTEVGEEMSNNNGKGRVGLLISRDSFFKPKPLDPGAVKVAAVMAMLQKRQTSLSLDNMTKKDSGPKDKKDGSSDAKIFEKMSAEDKASDKPIPDATPSVAPDKVEDTPKDGTPDVNADPSKAAGVDDAKPSDDKAKAGEVGSDTPPPPSPEQKDTTKPKDGGDATPAPAEGDAGGDSSNASATEMPG